MGRPKMDFKFNHTQVNGISLILMLLVSVFLAPMNFGYAAEPTGGESNGDDSATAQQVSDTCGILPDVKDSFILSVVTVCLPGVLEKVREWNEIECEAVLCIWPFSWRRKLNVKQSLAFGHLHGEGN